jgi:hypothetical protein
MTPLEAYVKATRVRARAYCYVRREAGETGDRILGNAAYRLGVDKATRYPADTRESAASLAAQFVSDPIGSEAFAQRITKAESDTAVVEMKRCALVEEWLEMGCDPAEIDALCSCANRVDFGTVETSGYELEFLTRIAAGQDRCTLKMTMRLA